jgi:hypothetical protein
MQRSRSFLSLVTTVCCLFVSARMLLAQPSPPLPEPAETVPDQQAADEAGNEAETPSRQQRPPRDRIIYIPFKDLDGTFEQPEAEAILPYEEYRKLLEAWKESRRPKDPPEGVITQAEYIASVDDDLVRIRARLTVNVLGDRWAEVPIRFGPLRGSSGASAPGSDQNRSGSSEPTARGGQAAVGRVRGDGVLLRGTGEGQYALLFSSPGEQEVELELATRIVSTPDGQEFSLTVPPVAVTTLDVTVPKRNQELHIQPRIVPLPVDRDEEADVTRVKASLGATETISVRWHPQASLRPEMDLLASVTNQTLVNIEDGLLHTQTSLTYEILRGELETLRAVVPGGQRILDVNADVRVRSWKTEEAGENQIVEVELLSAADKRVTVQIHTERPLAEEEFHLAGIDADGTARGIHALDAVRESGQIAVRHASDLALTVVEQRGMVRIEPAEVVPRLRGTNALTYKFYSTDLTLRLAARPVEPRITVAHQARFTFDEDELRFVNRLQYTVERAGVFELVLQLPDDVTIDDVQSAAMKEFRIDPASNRLTVSLRERTQGGIPLTVQGHRNLGRAREVELTLPVLEPLEVERETGAIFIFAPEAIELITDQENLISVQPLPVTQVPEFQFEGASSSAGSSTAGVPGRGQALQSAWSFTRRPVVIPVRTVRKPTRLSALVATTIDVQPELTQVRTRIDYLIEYSEIDQFRFEVPETVSERVRIELEGGDDSSAAIRQRTAGEPHDGWVTWTVRTQRPLVGRQRLIVSYDLPMAEGSELEETALNSRRQEILMLRPLGVVDEEGEPVTPLTSVRGEIVLHKERSLSVASQAEGGGVEAIDIRELTLLPPAGTTAPGTTAPGTTAAGTVAPGTAAYRYFKHDPDDRTRVRLTRSRHDIQEVVATVIPRALVEVVAGEDAQATYRCRFLVKTTERQRLLMHLPVNLELLGAFLNEREIKLEQADGAEGPPRAVRLELPLRGHSNSGAEAPNEPREGASPGDLWAPYWINVARTGSSDEPFLLTFQFLWPVKPTLGEAEAPRGRMTLPLPIPGDETTTLVQELKTVVWVPEEYALVGDPPRFELNKLHRPGSLLLGRPADSSTFQLGSWVNSTLASPSGFAQFPTEGRVPYVYHNLGGAKEIQVTWWYRWSMTLFLSVAVAVIGWILMRTSWENKLGILLLAAFAAALYGLTDSHGLAQGLAAARLGLAVLLGLWLIHALFGWTRQNHAPGKRASPSLPVPYAVIPPPGVFEHLHPRKD